MFTVHVPTFKTSKTYYDVHFRGAQRFASLTLHGKTIKVHNGYREKTFKTLKAYNRFMGIETTPAVKKPKTERAVINKPAEETPKRRTIKAGTVIEIRNYNDIPDTTKDLNFYELAHSHSRKY